MPNANTAATGAYNNLATYQGHVTSPHKMVNIKNPVVVVSESNPPRNCGIPRIYHQNRHPYEYLKKLPAYKNVTIMCIY